MSYIVVNFISIPRFIPISFRHSVPRFLPIPFRLSVPLRHSVIPVPRFIPTQNRCLREILRVFWPNKIAIRYMEGKSLNPVNWRKHQNKKVAIHRALRKRNVEGVKASLILTLGVRCSKPSYLNPGLLRNLKELISKIWKYFENINLAWINQSFFL